MSSPLEKAIGVEGAAFVRSIGRGRLAQLQQEGLGEEEAKRMAARDADWWAMALLRGDLELVGPCVRGGLE